MAERVLVGMIAGAHGVRGEVRIRSFTDDPAAVAAYGPLSDESGQRRFALTVIGRSKGGVIARLQGVADRTAAEALKGLRLYVPRSALPAPAADEYYRVDLIGLRVELADGTSFGRITDVQNYGAGDLLEIERPDGATELLPFADRTVPLVDVAAGRIVVDPPVYVEARQGGGGEHG
jgi:16S rRNA processing protein RimM